MQVMGVRVEIPSNQPIVLLQEQEGPRLLPIWIGAVEATAIATAMEGELPPRPFTHDLLRNVLEVLEVNVQKVLITSLRDSIFYAEVVLSREAGEVTISSRPSDAIALAVRTDAQVFASGEVLEEAGIEIEEEEGEEETVAKFREFLEGATVEDFLDSGETEDQ